MLRVIHLILPLLSLIPVGICISSCDSGESKSISDALKNNGLPVGLFPRSVKKFNIDDAGSFCVLLDQACNLKFESELHYDETISGNMSYGEIGSLSGVHAQELFLWLPVKRIYLDVPSSGVIYFYVDDVRKQFTVSLFETQIDCIATENQAAVSDEKLVTVSYKSQLADSSYESDVKNSRSV